MAKIVSKIPEAADELDKMKFSEQGEFMHVRLIPSSVSPELWAKIKKTPL